MPPEQTFPHENAARFESSVSSTAGAEGFRPDLVEKDYFCSLVLERLGAVADHLVFKGGTCLGKVYLDFFRLSEDLDFCIPLPERGGRLIRRKAIAPIKKAIAELPLYLPGLTVTEPLTGQNESTQYVALVSYASLFGARQNGIKIEISLRENLLAAPAVGMARTILRDAFTGEELLPPFPIRSIGLPEALAEKTRAALCRRNPAIRDFFDLDFAAINSCLNMSDTALIELVRKKIAIPGNDPLNLSDERRSELEKQVESQLRPVLRSRDFARFDLGRIWAELVRLADRLKT